MKIKQSDIITDRLPEIRESKQKNNNMNELPTPETDAESCYPDSNLGECVCADFARKLERERDEARGIIMKIEEIFIDSEDMHDDWMKVGNIAKEYFKK